MDLPEFEPPKITQPPASPSAGPPSLPPPLVSQAAEPQPPYRKWLSVVRLAAAAIAAVLLLISVFRARSLRKDVDDPAKSFDSAAMDGGKDIVDERETARLSRKIAEVRALVERARQRRARAKDVQALSVALDAAAALLQNRNFEQADRQIEAVKKSLPPIPVSNPLPVAPRPIDVPAPPKERIVTPASEGAPPARGSRKKKAPKKTRKPAP